MRNLKSGSLLDRFFDVGVAIKGIDGLLETAGGVLLLLVTKAALNHIVIGLTQHELSEDPNDLIASWIRHAVLHLSPNTRTFGAAYLLGHGAVKIFLAVELLLRKVWSYPVAIVFLCAFVCYQIYRISTRFSWGLLLLTVVDVVIIILVWREYRLLKDRGEKRKRRS